MILIRMLGLVALAYLGACAWLYFTQRSQMYFPTVGRADVPVMVLDRDGVDILVSQHEGAHASAVIYFGGNAEDVSRALPAMAAARPGENIYAMHYRGYGGSGGSPSEAALVGDALALYDQLSVRYAQISLIGRSLGSGIAVQVAAQREVDQLVLVTPFDSLAEVAAGHFPWVPVKLLLEDRYESARYAAQIEAPVRIVIAGRDQVIPPVHAQRLADAFGAGRVEVHTLPDADHNDLGGEPDYLGLLGSPAPQQVPAMELLPQDVE